jgi:4-hydroxybenzoate polyprenyltransferase
VSLACCVPLSLLSGRRAAAAHLAGVALAWGYNAGLKATAWSWVPYGASFALLVTFVEEGRPGRPGPEWWELPAAALLGVGAHFANVIPDLERDEANGVRGLPNRLGRRGSVAATIGAVLGASALVALGPRRRDRAALGFPAGVALLAAGAAGERRRPGTLFRATIAVALVDVALLVSRVRRRS